jgi:catechol 2,3-dioxygenase-like lactoylglutathione lyase family enzyme
MLHHVALEIRGTEAEADGRFWELLGFERFPLPEEAPAAWYEREGTHIHLMHVEGPAVPSQGHVGVIESDIDAAVERLEAAGFEVSERDALWGERRVKVNCPSGHLVELMAGPPPTISQVRAGWTPGLP